MNAFQNTKLINASMLKNLNIYGIHKYPTRIFMNIYNNNEWGIIIDGRFDVSGIELGIGCGYPYLTIRDRKVYNFINNQLNNEYTNILLPDVIKWIKGKLDKDEY